MFQTPVHHPTSKQSCALQNYDHYSGGGQKINIWIMFTLKVDLREMRTIIRIQNSQTHLPEANRFPLIKGEPPPDDPHTHQC